MGWGRTISNKLYTGFSMMVQGQLSNNNEAALQRQDLGGSPGEIPILCALSEEEREPKICRNFRERRNIRINPKKTETLRN